MKYTGYEIVEMIAKDKINENDTFILRTNLDKEEFNVKMFGGLLYIKELDSACYINMLSDSFSLKDIAKAEFELIANDNIKLFGENKPIEELDAKQSESPFEETLANKVNEIIRRFNDANS